MKRFKRLLRPTAALAEEQALSWMAKILGQPLSQKQQAEFAVWLNLHPSHRAHFDALVEVWELAGELTPAAAARIVAAVDSQAQLQSHATPPEQFTPTPTATNAPQAQTRSRRRFNQRRWPIAASSLLAFTLIWFSATNLPGARVIETDTGGYTKVTLADGSKLHLNTNSRVRILFTDEARSLQLLKGELFIEVAKDAQRPLSVTTSTFSATAIGTAFGVAATDNLQFVEVAHGEVLVTNNPTNDYRARGDGHLPMQLSLLAGDKLDVDPGAQTLGEVQADRPQFATWRGGRLYYEDVALKDLLQDLNRYHPRKLVLQERELGRLRVSAVLNSGDQAAATEALCQSLNLQAHNISESVTLLARSPAQ